MAPRAGTDKPQLSVVGAGPPPEPPKVGLASLSRDDRAALRLRHVAGMRPVIAELDQAKATVKAIQKRLTALRNSYKGDGFSLAILDEKLANEGKPRRDALAYEQERHECAEDLGQAVYVQPDLFASMPVEAQDEEYWRECGYQAGIQGQQGKPPRECPERFVQLWMKGWGGGQEKLAWALAEKTDTNPERTRTDIAATKVELEPEPQDEEPDLDPATIAAKAKDLKASGFADRPKGRRTGTDSELV